MSCIKALIKKGRIVILMTLNKTVRELEQVIVKIKFQKFYKIIGFLLVPLIGGFFIIKKLTKPSHT